MTKRTLTKKTAVRVGLATALATAATLFVARLRRARRDDSEDSGAPEGPMRPVRT